MPAINLRAKILLPIAGMILLVVLASLAIVNNGVKQQVLNNMSEDLGRARLVFEQLHERQIALLIEKSRVVAGTPYLKAAIETGDPLTVQRVADEVFFNVPSNILFVTDREGKLLADE